MNNIQLCISGHRVSPNTFLYPWRKHVFDLEPDKEYEEELVFPSDVVAIIPDEDEIIPEKIIFNYKLTNGFIPKASTLDAHILEGMGTSYEIKDEKGNVVSKLTADEVSLGFDTKLEIGKFYINPNLHNYYYCEKIANDLVHYILVESYQFGKLIQARIVQKTKYSVHYVEVKDKKRLDRLKKKLNSYLGNR